VDREDCNARCKTLPPARSAAFDAEPLALIRAKLSLMLFLLLELCFATLLLFLRLWFLGRMPVMRVACSSIGNCLPSIVGNTQQLNNVELTEALNDNLAPTNSSLVDVLIKDLPVLRFDPACLFSLVDAKYNCFYCFYCFYLFWLI
jgi:hypothetical protein